jgi:hypothetical protein
MGPGDRSTSCAGRNGAPSRYSAAGPGSLDSPHPTTADEPDGTRNWARGMIGGARVLPYQVEYVCLTCGHRGWSRHTNAGRLALVDPNFESKTEETNA